MAKTQNLSLNPTKISGTCGRLMCCLKYEQDAYEDLLRSAPKADSFVDTPEGRGTIVEVDLLRQRVKVKMELQPEVTHVFANADIAVLRSGKAKKNDPPIPDDLAPISGGAKRAPKAEAEEEKPVFLDSIRFRYSTETIAEETSPEEPAQEEAAEPKEHTSRNRRRRNRRPANQQADKPAEVKAEVTQKKPQQKKPQPPKPEAPAQAGQEKPKSANRRPHHRRRRPAKPAGGNPAE